MSAVVQSWLDAQCASLDGVASAMVFLLTGQNRALMTAAVWPRGSQANPNLSSVAQVALHKQQPVVATLNREVSSDSAGAVICHPLTSQGRAIGAVALAVKPGDEAAAQATLQRLSQGIASFEQDSSAVPGAQIDSAAVVLQFLATVLAQESFSDAATALATELAARLRCERVSVGVANARCVEVVALSHSGEIAKDQALLRDIGTAMDEALTQHATVQYPQLDRDKPRITLQHSNLLRNYQATCVVTAPLVSGARSFGAICFEFQRAVGAEQVKLIEDVASFLAPVLVLKHAQQGASVDRALGKVKGAAGKLVGKGHLGFKLALLGATLLAALLAVVPTTFYVTAEARVEGAVQRALVAPTDGYLKKTHVRPADRVKAGQVLAELADEDLKLNERKWESELAQAESAYGDALAKHDRAQIVVQQARMEEARAQLELTQQEITRSQLVAPFDGVIIKGDLTQSLGAPVKRGEQLLTLAPSDQYRVIVEVDERDVALLSAGTAGRLALGALSGEALPIKIVRVTPVAHTEHGRHYFEVEAAFEGTADAQLRPGLRGVAKMPAGERSLLSNWTRRAVQSLKLQYWSWFG